VIVTEESGESRIDASHGMRELGWTGKGAGTPSPATKATPDSLHRTGRSPAHMVPWVGPLWLQRNVEFITGVRA